MTFKSQEEFCKSKHLLTTGNCHMVATCEECQEIWHAAQESALAGQGEDAGKYALCEGMPHGSCKGETMCDPKNRCFKPAVK